MGAGFGADLAPDIHIEPLGRSPLLAAPPCRPLEPLPARWRRRQDSRDGPTNNGKMRDEMRWAWMRVRRRRRIGTRMRVR